MLELLIKAREYGLTIANRAFDLSDLVYFFTERKRERSIVLHRHAGIKHRSCRVFISARRALTYLHNLVTEQQQLNIEACEQMYKLILEEWSRWLAMEPGALPTGLLRERHSRYRFPAHQVVGLS